MKVWLLKSLTIGLIFTGTQKALSAESSDAAVIELKVERLGGMTHLEFSGQKEWDYQLSKEKDQLKITLPKIKGSSIDAIKDFSSLLVGKIDINDEVSNKSTLTIKLNDSRIESFDYLMQNPDNLVVDLFVEDDKILAEIQRNKQLEVEKQKALAAKEKAKNESTQKVAKKPSAEKGDRRPAFAEFYINANEEEQAKMAKNNKPLPTKPELSVTELFDFATLAPGSEFTDGALEAKVIEAEGNIYLRFPLLKLDNKHLQELQSFRPEYEIRTSYSDENKQARNLLTLFNQKSYASFIKAKKLFKKTFPQSTYDEILNYVEADTWIELWKMAKRPEYLRKAMDIYKMLIERYPNSRIAERTLIQAGLLSHEAGEYFVATKMLRRYLKLYPNSPFNNHIKIYLGDSLANLNNYDGARDVLEEVVKANERGTSAEAMYRMGDIFFQKQSYRRAEKAYDEALKTYPEYANRYPNALFNKAEAQFNLAEYPSSLKSYKKFYQTYNTHPYSAYALTRVGELIDLLYEDRHRAQGFYNESFFRFRNTTGGTVARMRSLSQRFKDMNPQELQSSIQEIGELEKKTALNQVDEFASFMESDGYYQRGDYLKAANTLINYFQVNPKPVNIKKFEKRISRAIAGEILERLKKGDVVAALNIIENHQKSWLSKSRRVDVQMFRAMAYEKMNLFGEALESYERIENRMKNLAGTKEEKERKVFEYYPTYDQVYLRQAVSHYKLKQPQKTLSNLNRVKNISGLDDQSKVDFYYTLSQLSFDKQKFAEALKIVTPVTNLQIEDPEKRQKFNIYLSEVLEKNKKYDEAIAILEKFYEKFNGEQDQVYVLSRLFDLYRNNGQTEKAIKVGTDLLRDYANKYNVDKERYYLGELFFNQNDQKQAKAIWKDLTKKSMWSELATNKSENSNWKKETDDKMNRIPAMAK